ncbi:hypothetical protein [Ruania zhangjianzhongii]|uniref:hypothetical protein n=1 Tax=Ruania zhangjianzhongii TaxID=2603206 RepID=UPI0011C73ECA|nr:hypothetical protein [Ruania zhangjianzhongii]
MAPAPHPPLVVVQALFAALAARGQVVLGGSALLYALGLTGTVRDWDLVTDVPADQVAEVLAARGLPAVLRSGDSPQFATAALFQVDAGDHDIDVLVDFAIRSGGEAVPIPPRAWRSWNQMMLAAPQDWERAYRLMGRVQKAELLRDWLVNGDGPTSAGDGQIRA